MKNLNPPRRPMEEHIVFVAVNKNDSSDRFGIEAPNELAAKTLLIYKLGYRVEKVDETFWLVDDEKADRRFVLASSTLEAAYDEVLGEARWDVTEPIVLVGGGK